MDKGSVIEYDTVPALLANPKGTFYALVKESGMNIDALLKGSSANNEGTPGRRKIAELTADGNLLDNQDTS